MLGKTPRSSDHDVWQPNGVATILIGWDCPRQLNELSTSVLVWTNIPVLAAPATTTTTSDHDL